MLLKYLLVKRTYKYEGAQKVITDFPTVNYEESNQGRTKFEE